MDYFLKVALGLLMMAASAAIVAWAFWRSLKKSEEPYALILKWILTVAAFLFLILVVAGMGWVGAPIAAIVGILLGIIWAPSLGAILAKPLMNMYSDDQEVEARPFYSIARAKINRGNTAEAIDEVKKQLTRFPEDYEGWMLLAEIYGDHLKDNDAAQRCVAEILAQKGHAPRNITFALNRSADWHLKLASDRQAARGSLERITELFPESEFALNAAQRIAHLVPDQMLASQRERPRIALTRHETRIGLEGEVAAPKEREELPDAKTGRLVSHLNEHPLDVEAREELATLYAEHYQRMDLAMDQLEQLILAPGATQKRVARCLNLIADLQLRVGKDRGAAEAALKRITDLYPGSAVAASAEKRLAYLEIEVKRHQGSQPIRLGSYEQNIGLKGQTPRYDKDG